MKNRKHVLFIQTDEWSGRFFGYAGHPVIMTPTIDQIAKNGIVYDNCYSTCPVCIPARRSLMTGTFPVTHGDRVYSATMRMPEMTTMAQAFREAGYQTVAVGKLHVYPQRTRIGFDEVILQEEGRYEFGVTDDYQIWLGENGYTGLEFMHGLGNNTYYTRPWPLDEKAHPTSFVTREAVRQIKRRDPERPGFFYVSYQFPHPPLVPLQSYLDMYDLSEMPESIGGDWEDDSFIMQEMQAWAKPYTKKEIAMAKRAYYAQCTYIDHQIRLLIGTLRENEMLDDTIIVFTSDHGDMLFDHGMCAKRCFYENSANVPLIFSGKPLEKRSGTVDHRIACLEDVMPTLLSLCNIDIPETVEGMPLLSAAELEPDAETNSGADSVSGSGSDSASGSGLKFGARRSVLFGEISDGPKATRMAYDGRYKLIYYPYGNVFQLFDELEDREERVNLAGKEEYTQIKERLEQVIVEKLHGDDDVLWIKDGRLVGVEAPEYKEKPDYGLINQRGLHWPSPQPFQA